jgi:hypothetical protein
MSHSSIRGPAGRSFVWSVPGKQVEIDVSQAVLAQLPPKFARDSSAEVREFGGVLLGHIEQTGETYYAHIEALQPFEIEHRFDRAFALSPKDRTRLKRLLRKRWRKDLIPIGWYRSHERLGLYMDARDFDLFQSEFPHPGAVVLLVRQDAQAGTIGGFFIREGEDVQRHTTYKQFPIVAPPPEPHDAQRKVRTPPKELGPHRDWAASTLAVVLLLMSFFYVGRAFAAFRYRQTHSAQTAPIDRSSSAPLAGGQ